MTRPLVRRVTDCGDPVYVLPSRVVSISPAVDRVDATGAQVRCVIGLLETVVDRAPTRQFHGTLLFILRGSPDEVAAQLWPEPTPHA